MKNSLRVWNEKLCEEVWEAFSAPAAAEKVEVKAEEVIGKCFTVDLNFVIYKTFQ